MEKKFSELVEQLVSLWLEWMDLNAITTNENMSYADRRKSAERQEELTNNRYVIIQDLNNFFNNDEH